MTTSSKLPPFRRPSTPPPLGWNALIQKLDSHPCGLIVFDYTVSDQRYAYGSVLNHKCGDDLYHLGGDDGTINCVYIKPSNEMCWILDRRRHCEKIDRKNAHQHVQEMLAELVKNNPIPFSIVIMKTWYATESIMHLLDRFEKTYWCPVRSNRLVRYSKNDEEYVPVSVVPFEDIDFVRGKYVFLKSFPKDIAVKLFRLDTAEDKTTYAVTNHLIENAVQIAEIMFGVYQQTKKTHTIN